MKQGKNLITAALFAATLTTGAAWGQEEANPAGVQEEMTLIKGKVEGLEESYLATKSTVDKLAKIKFSGYTQVQMRTTTSGNEAEQDTNASYVGKYNHKVGDFAGGAFADGTQQVFQVRRGRLKLTYDNDLTQSVIQLDCIPTGVTIKDAYLLIREPWLKSIALKGGVYDRPFGFEISYSSSNRESPERSRLFQTLFPGERDLGMGLEFVPAENLPRALQYFNFKGGVFTGNAIANENDKNWDAIGRLGFSLPFADLGLAVDGGASMYRGLATVINDTAFAWKDTTFVRSLGNKFKDFDRNYTGLDLQLYYDLPVVGGMTLRGEFVSGTQPSTAAAGTVYSGSTAPLYSRSFSGWYLYYVQNLNPIKSQFVLKYDVYDPNTDVEGKELTKNRKLTNAELKYSTLGLGWIYHWDENVKLVAYYDMVTNEEMDAATLGHDAKYRYYTENMKDDVFTFRIQYKF